MSCEFSNISNIIRPI